MKQKLNLAAAFLSFSVAIGGVILDSPSWFMTLSNVGVGSLNLAIVILFNVRRLQK
jgi:hypothetical protein